jgi:hypothetical protein
MRPQSIVNFERIVILYLVLGLVSTALNWQKMVAMVAQAHLGPGWVIGSQAVAIAIYLLLIWFIAHKASVVAKWIYVVLTVLGLVVGLINLPKTMALGAHSAILSCVQYVLAAIALWLLFRPDSRAWFSEGRDDVG